MKRFLFILSIVPIVCFLGACTGIFIFNRPTGVGKKEVEIRHGATVKQISQQLYQKRLIHSPRLLQYLAQLNGSSSRLKAGIHPLDGQMTTWEILLELERSRDVTQNVTVPEGLEKKQIATILSEKLNLDQKKLLLLMNSAAFCITLSVQAKDLEGYLFPETYNFPTTVSEQQVLRRMVEHCQAVFDERLQRRAHELGMSIHEVITFASIIEGETSWDSERDTIAAVYHNRLKKGMRLQADPTVQYALPGEPRRLFYKDYDYDSPYNTYRHSGLPPGPINSPGRASIVAALFPADVDYLYFVATGEGGHVFTHSLQEHAAAKKRTAAARKNTWQKKKLVTGD
ncbi:MAG: endolytic transglycosylase MltG [Gemmatimonadetes bacterium]|nr:endolytic transglycosylase MltG [Gemmatimonadota bacterium]MYB58815.1 endolytic transglycosylase MltG [Gemmatimonadota bacterium]